jgi:predicted RNase H-like nuclease
MIRSSAETTYVGVDGCSDGWIAVTYSETDFVDAEFYENVSDLWSDNSDAEQILIDVPIGLRETSNNPRKCDEKAREKLKPDRYRSIFATPIRDAAHKGTYEEAKEKQEAETDGSLSTQTWGITPKIRQVDLFLSDHDEASELIRESHPEVCFWAFAGEPMEHSKTGNPAQAFWERVEALSDIDPKVCDHLYQVGSSDLGGSPSNDDLLDAFALALTAKGELATLPENPEEDQEGLRMEIVYPAQLR